MADGIKSGLHIAVEFEESLTRLQTVVQCLSEDELKDIRMAVRSLASTSSKTADDVVWECVLDALKGVPFDDTAIGQRISLIKEGRGC